MIQSFRKEFKLDLMTWYAAAALARSVLVTLATQLCSMSVYLYKTAFSLARDSGASRR